jgi:hypothetical protein
MDTYLLNLSRALNQTAIGYKVYSASEYYKHLRVHDNKKRTAC